MPNYRRNYRVRENVKYLLLSLGLVGLYLLIQYMGW